jgi:hypothetical protein
MHSPLTSEEINASHKLYVAAFAGDREVTFSPAQVQALWSRLKFDAIHLRNLKDEVTPEVWQSTQAQAERTCGREITPA